MSKYWIWLFWLFFGTGSKAIGDFFHPYVGVIHAHSVWDDGSRTLENWWEEAKENGWSFVFVTVHAGVVDNPKKLINRREVDGPVGYHNFVAECRRLSKRDGGKVKIIPSVELGVASHALILGVEKEKDFYRGLELSNTQGQRAALEFFYKKRYVVIAAHPDFYRLHPDPENWKVNKKTSLFFDFDALEKSHVIGNTYMPHINGVELLNYGDNQAAEQNPFYYFGKYMFPTPMVIGGCDFHTLQAEDGLWLWDKLQPVLRSRYPMADDRLTVIWSHVNSVERLIFELGAAHCAACYGKNFRVGDLPQGYVPGTGWGVDRYGSPRVREEYDLPDSVSGRYRWWNIKYSLAKGIQLIPKPYQTIAKGKSAKVVFDGDWDSSCYIQYWALELETNKYDLIGSPQMITTFD